MSVQPVVVDFARRTDEDIAADYAAREVRRQASPGQVQWLDEHRVAWLEALTALMKDAEGRIGQSRAHLRSLAPLPGVQPTAEYMALKREEDAREVRRTTFLRHVKARRDAVAALVGRVAPSPKVLVDAIVRAVDLLDRDDVDGAYDLLVSILDRVDDAARADRTGQ